MRCMCSTPVGSTTFDAARRDVTVTISDDWFPWSSSRPMANALSPFPEQTVDRVAVSLQKPGKDLYTLACSSWLLCPEHRRDNCR